MTLKGLSRHVGFYVIDITRPRPEWLLERTHGTTALPVLDTGEEQYARLNDFLVRHSPSGTFLFEAFGLVETVFTTLFMRFWFLEYYEGFDLPQDERYARVRRWREACLAHPAAQQVTKEQIVKL